MVDARHFCPDCGSIELKIINQGVKGPSGESMAQAYCISCSWRGSLSETIGAATTEQFWDSDRLGDVLLRVLATRAAGPLVQLYEFVGFLPRKKDLPQDPAEAVFVSKWNEAAQNARDAVMRAVLAAAVTASFEEAERQNRLFAIAMNTDIHPMLKDSDEEEIRESKERVFGGRPKKKRS